MGRHSRETKRRRLATGLVMRRSASLITSVVTLSAALVAFQPVPAAQALSGSEFNPGFIISDELFYDGSAMTAAQIQAFLDNKIGSCQNDRCLNVASLPVTTRPVDYSSATGALVCSEISGGTMRPAELIYRTQVACGISAKVILVTLQKEQGLITSRAPSESALRAAMGMGCPDTAPCDSAFAGLATQIMTGTRQLKVYKAGKFSRQPGTHFIQYNPDSSCGGTNVEIRNYATAALYNYTPYQPNAASLANLGTTGDGCSSYGNRNFWAYYNNWFGPTTEPTCVTNPSRDITTYWSEQGGSAGALGVPVSPGIVSGAAGAVGFYANGSVYCTPRIGAVGVIGDSRTTFEALGGPSGALGAPLATRVPFSAGGLSGYVQEFQRGTMLSSATTGSHAVMHGAVRDAWGSRGGSAGILGWPVGDQEAVSGSVRQRFQHGVISVATGKAPIVLVGEIGALWSTGTNAAALGAPTSTESPLTAGGVTGSLQYFERGMVLSSTSTGTRAVLNGAVRNAWGAQGGSGGALGWPVGDQQATADGFRQEFQFGTIFASASGAGGTLLGDIATYWGAGTNATKLGYPTAAATAWTAGGVTGMLQYFEKGLVLSSSVTGTYAVLDGPIRNAWGASGGSGGSAGWPTGDQATVSGQLSQQFQRATLSASAGVSANISNYLATGSNAARLGASTGNATAWTAGGVSGALQYFSKGMVLSSATTGTFAVLNGPIRDAWGAQGGSGGTLGWPISDQTTVSGQLSQQFQRGVISISTGGAGGAIDTYMATGNNAALFGAATGAPQPWTAGGVTGTLQYFAQGMVLSSATTGTYGVLSGPMRTAWGAQGGSGGSLGWPTGDQTLVAGKLRQQFQNGVLTVSSSGAGSVLTGDIATYWSTGSNASLLGEPTGSATSWTSGGITGTLQNFARGVVLSSSTTGTFAVVDGPLRNAWGAQGGTGGALGWPVSDQTVVTGGIRQQFVGGSLTITDEGATILLSGAYYTYWSAGTNATALGAPIATVTPWAAGGVTGSYLVFERGMVMSSATTGTFAVLNGPIRNFWGSQGGSVGVLGWPTADQLTVPEGIQQQFQGGTVVIPTTGPAYIVPIP